MFKKVIFIVMALAIVICSATSASAICMSEDGRPSIVGMELYDKIEALEEANKNNSESIYEVSMIQTGNYWTVILTGMIEGDYVAMGFYDHMPSEEEIDVLWANRMTVEEMGELQKELGF